jgi:hypothetical protein
MTRKRKIEKTMQAMASAMLKLAVARSCNRNAKPLSPIFTTAPGRRGPSRTTRAVSYMRALRGARRIVPG